MVSVLPTTSSRKTGRYFSTLCIYHWYDSFDEDLEERGREMGGGSVPREIDAWDIGAAPTDAIDGEGTTGALS